MAVGIAAFLSDLEARPESVEGHARYRRVRFSNALTLDSLLTMLMSTFGTGVVKGKPVTGCIRLNREIFKGANAIASLGANTAEFIAPKTKVCGSSAAD